MNWQAAEGEDRALTLTQYRQSESKVLLNLIQYGCEHNAARCVCLRSSNAVCERVPSACHIWNYADCISPFFAWHSTVAVSLLPLFVLGSSIISLLLFHSHRLYYFKEFVFLCLTRRRLVVLGLLWCFLACFAPFHSALHFCCPCWGLAASYFTSLFLPINICFLRCSFHVWRFFLFSW